MTRRVMVSDLDKRSAERVIELNDSLDQPTRAWVRQIAAAVRVDDYDDPHKPFAVFLEDTPPPDMETAVTA